MCLAALLLSADTGNCIALLVAAEAAGGCPELAHRALDILLADPVSAVEADPESFARLPIETLIEVLSHGALNVEEDRVLLMLVQWATGGYSDDATKASRTKQLAEVADRCIRPSQLTYQQLVALDGDTTVCKSIEAIQLVAGYFIRMMMGNGEPVSQSDRPRELRGRPGVAQPMMLD
jgi:hypothetical protein